MPDDPAAVPDALAAMPGDLATMPGDLATMPGDLAAMPGDLAAMALHDVTERLGEPGLRARFAIEADRFPAADRARLADALAWAGDLHRDDRRGREPYVNHLLRVAIRIAHHYRVTDPDVVCAAVLHDAVEDHADDIAGPVFTGPGIDAADHVGPVGGGPGIVAADRAGSRDAALAVVAGRFGARVAALVAAVTNPVYDRDRDVHEQYRAHVRASLAADPWARVVKLSDFTDNAVGIVWSLPDKARKVAPKYLPLVADLRELAGRPDTPLADDVKRDIDAQLALAATRLAAHAG